MGTICCLSSGILKGVSSGPDIYQPITILLLNHQESAYLGWIALYALFTVGVSRGPIDLTFLRQGDVDFEHRTGSLLMYGQGVLNSRAMSASLETGYRVIGVTLTSARRTTNHEEHIGV